MKPIFIVLILILPSFSSASEREKYDIETFCQDINVLTQRIGVLTLNITNHKTTRTITGGPYKRKIVTKCIEGQCTVVTDQAFPILKYEPSHPDARENGYVAYPYFSLEEEKAKLIKAESAYKLVMNNMPTRSIDFLIGDKYDDCLSKYKHFKNHFNFKEYLGR